MLEQSKTLSALLTLTVLEQVNPETSVVTDIFQTLQNENVPAQPMCYPSSVNSLKQWGLEHLT